MGCFLLLLLIKAIVLSPLIANIPVYSFRKNQLIGSGRLIAHNCFGSLPKPLPEGPHSNLLRLGRRLHPGK